MNRNINNTANCVAVTRALMKARSGDREALRWLMEQRTAGNAGAKRALDQYNAATARPAA